MIIPHRASLAKPKNSMLAKCVSGKSGCYASEEEARKALKEIKKHRTPHRKERAYYDCPHCDFWHLTEKSRQW